jgi:hypothetical protein
MNFVVFAALLLTAAFVAVWIVSPALRTRIERPKYRFQERLQKDGDGRP